MIPPADIDNFTHMTRDDEVKFVVGSRQDYEFAVSIIKKHLAGHPKERIHISPVSGAISLPNLAQWILQGRLNARMSLQQHKIIWDADIRGV